LRDKTVKPETGSLSRIPAMLLEGGLLCLILLGFLWLEPDRPSMDAILYRPIPDAAEQVYVARAFSSGNSPLLPISVELHPSRYSPVHPFLVSLWMRLHFGRMTSIYSWSLFAVILGVALLYLFLICSGAPFPFRVLALYLILFTPLFITITRNIMQEPTMLLLFGATCLLWRMGMRGALEERVESGGGSRRKGKGLFFFFLAGFTAGAIFCIRVTTFPLIVCFVLHGIWMLSPRRAARCLPAFSCGILACVTLVTVYMASLAGIFNVAGYYHWMPFQTFFAWNNAFIPAPNTGIDVPNGLLILQDMLGIRPAASVFGWYSTALLLIGGPAGFILMKKTGEQNKGEKSLGVLSLLLFLFAISQVVIHMFYMFNDLRFFVLAWPALVLSGVSGWYLILKTFFRKRWMRRGYTVVFAVIVFSLMMGITNYIHGFTIMTSLKEKSRERGECISCKAMHEKNGLLIEALSCPIFVDRVSVLNARLLFDLMDRPYPIAPLTRQFDLTYGGHTIQFLWYRVRPPVGCLPQSEIWEGRPPDHFLFDPGEGSVRDDFIDTMMNRYGKIALYFPYWRREELKPLIEYIREEGYGILKLNRRGPWDLVLVRGKVEKEKRGDHSR